MILPFFASPDVDFIARTAVGHAAMGTSDIGPVLEVLSRCTDDDPAGWYAAWHEQADRLRAAAVDARAAGGHGHRRRAVPVGQRVLRPVAGPRRRHARPHAVLLPTFREHRAAWDDFVAASAGRHVPSDVPFEGDTLPGYLFRPDASGAARPTLVVTNGSDGALAGSGPRPSAPRSTAAGTRSSSTAPASSRCCSSAASRSATTGRRC